MNKNTIYKGLLLLPVGGTLLSLAMIPTAQAVPSFARQTGVSCSACHTAFPQLTAFGRQFKMQGYTLTSGQQVKSENLDLGLLAPLSMMIQTNWSQVKKAPDAETDKSEFKLPSQLSIFYAGRIADKMGAFVQVTSEDGGSFGQDNTDIRFADTGKLGDNNVTYGLTLNNNPTVQDPWNSTSVWGFPWFEAGYGYSYPHPMMESIGGNVAGVTGYGLWNNHLYTELGAYEAANSLGTTGPADGKVIKNAAPYWRLAYTADLGKMNWEVGTFGMTAKVPTNGFDASQDKFTDAGVDAQLQWIFDQNHTLTLDGNFIHEKQTLDATDPGLGGQHLDTMKVDLTYYTNQTWGLTAGYRGASSSTDASAFTDSIVDDGVLPSTGTSQNSDAYLFQVDYTPWLNTRFSLQYVDYQKLNGVKDGASDNNQLMLGAWFLF